MPDHTSQHRQCVISQQPFAMALSRFNELIGDREDTILISPRKPTEEVSRCLKLNCPKLNWVNTNGIKNLLGNTYSAVFLDFSMGLSLSLLSIMAGTVRGGGVIVVFLGEDWLSQPDQEMGRFLPHPYEPDQLTSQYKKMFFDELHKPDSPFSSDWPTQIYDATPALVALTEDQSRLLHTIDQADSSHHILLAPRGRGKSYSLAELLYLNVLHGKKCACTASSQNNLVTLLTHYEQLSDLDTPFFAPDALLQDNDHFDLLIVDEAASIPLPMLHQLAEKADKVVFSSTDYGYEGSGRGFGIRFRRELACLPKPVFEHQLHQPLRWGENDPFEQWLDALLFSPFEPDTLYEQQPLWLSHKDWAQHETLLKQSFALLVNAHYQTTPENLRWMVDDPSVKTFFSFHQGKLVGVAIVILEGPLDKTLIDEITQGTRRPRGHLFPQSLLAHEGRKNAGGYRYWRISRIAVQQETQRHGFGSKLIAEIRDQATVEDIDFLATSFAASEEVISFWHANHFNSVRLGTAKDQASGAYSLMMLQPLSQLALQAATLWQTEFQRQWLAGLPLNLRALTPSLILSISQTCGMGENPHIPTLHTQDVSDLTYFAFHHRPYDAIRPQLWLLVQSLLSQQKLDPKLPEHLLLVGCALNLYSERDAHRLGFNGKKAFYQAIKNIVGQFLETSKNG